MVQNEKRPSRTSQQEIKAIRKKHMRGRMLLIGAVQALTTGPDDIRYRLWNAYHHFSQIQPGDLPTPLEEDFAWVMKTIFERESKRPIRENPVQARFVSMKKTTGVKIAQRIFYITERLRTIYETDFSEKPYIAL